MSVNKTSWRNDQHVYLRTLWALISQQRFHNPLDKSSVLKVGLAGCGTCAMVK